jgi:Na+/proline symporter
MDTYLNKVSGFFTQNFYKPIIMKDKADNVHLMRVGQIVTLLIGVISIVNAVILSRTKVALFDVFQMVNSYIIIPMGVPIFLGLFIRRTPKWAPFLVIVIGAMITMFIYNDFQSATIDSVTRSLFGQEILDYIRSHKFAVANLVNMPLLSLIFVLSKYIAPEKNPKVTEKEDHFFKKMHTSVDFEKEVGGDNSALQAKLLGRLLLVYGAFTLLGVLIPNAASGRISFLVCALIMGGIGAILEYVYRRSLRH